MDTEMTRWLDWPVTLNTRELGGYPVAGGGRTRWGALVRSENPALLTQAGQQALIDYGIRTIIDLRFPSELAIDPSPFYAQSAKNETVVTYTNLPLEVDQHLDYQDGQDAAEAMCGLYCRLLETNRGHVAAVLGKIGSAPAGGVLFHCYAGKDRTGLIAAMLLSALGVSDEVIIQDYALTHGRLEERREMFLADPILPAEKKMYFQTLYNNLPNTMALTLKYLNQTYGSAMGYLATAGLTAQDIEGLRERFISA